MQCAIRYRSLEAKKKSESLNVSTRVHKLNGRRWKPSWNFQCNSSPSQLREKTLNALCSPGNSLIIWNYMRGKEGMGEEKKHDSDGKWYASGRTIFLPGYYRVLEKQTFERDRIKNWQLIILDEWWALNILWTFQRLKPETLSLGWHPSALTVQRSTR